MTAASGRMRALQQENRRLRARLAELESRPRGFAQRFDLQLLGVPRVGLVGPDGALTEVRLRLRRALRLLAFLATSPERRAPREELLEALWPDGDPVAIRRNFHPTLSALRRDLGVPSGGPQPIEVRSGVYGLSPAFVWRLDTEAFDHAVQQGREASNDGRFEDAVTAWEHGWKLYRGPLLEGLEDQAWLETRREALARRYLELLRALGEADERLGRTEPALDALRTLLLREPLQEDVHLAIMRLYASQGRRDLVRRQFDRMERLLHDELGVEPRLESSLEYRRLLG